LEAADAAGTDWTAVKIGAVESASHELGAQGYRTAVLSAGSKPVVAISSGNGIYYFSIPDNPAGGDWPKVHVSSNPSDEGFAFGDINGDGQLDIAGTTGDSKRVEWYLNPGDGSGEWTAYLVGTFDEALYPDRTEMADLNGDGRLDVIVTEENGEDSDAQTFWWEQPADPAGGEWTRHLITTQATTNSLDVADMNGDLYNVVNTPISMQWDKERILQNLRDAIRRQIQYAHRRSGSSIFRIGVATSGLVDETSGVSINFPRLEDWKDIPLRKILEQDFQVRTIVENRITAVTYAENLFGAKKDTRDALIFQLGPGLGMGMILGGHVRRGTKWSVGEFGHIAVTENGPLCYCGKRGCLESVASDFALVAQALQAIREGVNTRIPEFVESDGEITAEAICKAAEDGDRLAHGMIERVGHFIATGVANLLNVLGPEVIMFSGTMVESSDVLLDCIRRNLRVHTLEYIEKNVQVTRATFGANSGIQGAVTIALQDFFSCTE